MKVFLIIGAFILSCGQKEEKVEYKKIPYKGEDPAKVDGDIAFGHIEDSCMSCHASQAPIIASKNDMIKLKDSICSVVIKGSMPPSGPLPAPKVDEIKEDLCN